MTPPTVDTGIGSNAACCNKPDLVHEGGNWVLNDTDQIVQEDSGVALVSTAARPAAHAAQAAARAYSDMLGTKCPYKAGTLEPSGWAATHLRRVAPDGNAGSASTRPWCRRR